MSADWLVRFLLTVAKEKKERENQFIKEKHKRNRTNEESEREARGFCFILFFILRYYSYDLH